MKKLKENFQKEQKMFAEMESQIFTLNHRFDLLCVEIESGGLAGQSTNKHMANIQRSQDIKKNILSTRGVSTSPKSSLISTPRSSSVVVLEKILGTSTPSIISPLGKRKSSNEQSLIMLQTIANLRDETKELLAVAETHVNDTMRRGINVLNRIRLMDLFIKIHRSRRIYFDFRVNLILHNILHCVFSWFAL